MLKWENIQTKTELEYIIGVLKEKISCLEIKRIFSFYPEIPAKIDNEIVYKALIDPLYILFNDDYCLIINFIYYLKIYIEYRKLTDEERNQFINTIYNEEIDYFNSIKIILKNGITISMNPLPLEIGGEYNLIIEDKNNQLNYQITNVD